MRNVYLRILAHLIVSALMCTARRVSQYNDIAKLNSPWEGGPNTTRFVHRFLHHQLWIALQTLRVTDSVEWDSLTKKDLPPGTIMIVWELYDMPNVQRVRARIRSPIAGYVTVGTTNEPRVGAMPYAQYKIMHGLNGTEPALHSNKSDLNSTGLGPTDSDQAQGRKSPPSVPGHTCCCKDAGKLVSPQLLLSDEVWFFDDTVNTEDHTHTVEFRYPSDTPLHPATLRLCLVRNGWKDPWEVDNMTEGEMRSSIKAQLKSNIIFCAGCNKSREDIDSMEDKSLLDLCPLGYYAYKNRETRAMFFSNLTRVAEFEKYAAAVYEGKAGVRDRYVAPVEDLPIGECKGEDGINQGGYNFFFPKCGRMSHRGFMNLLPTDTTMNYFQQCAVRKYNCKWKKHCSSRTFADRIKRRMRKGRLIPSEKLLKKFGRSHDTYANDLCTDGSEIKVKLEGHITARSEAVRNSRKPNRDWWVAGASSQIRASPWCRDPKTKKLVKIN